MNEKIPNWITGFLMIDPQILSKYGLLVYCEVASLEIFDATIGTISLGPF